MACSHIAASTLYGTTLTKHAIETPTYKVYRVQIEYSFVVTGNTETIVDVCLECACFDQVLSSLRKLLSIDRLQDEKRVFMLKRLMGGRLQVYLMSVTFVNGV